MSRRAGFTLIEVLISVAILAFVISGISTVLIKQGQASSTQSLQRDLEQSGRLALLELGRAVRFAGYGIAPVAAFDFDRYACATPGTGTTCNAVTVGALTSNNPRDRTDGPDELVLSYRDPSFTMRPMQGFVGSGAGPYAVTLAAADKLIEDIKAGRIVQVMCAGADAAAYLSVMTDAPAGSTSLSLQPTAAADGYYPGGPAYPTCLSTAGQAWLMLVERVRFYVANDTDGVPTLFKERGRGFPEKLYRGIEDIQFTYGMSRPPPGSPFAAGGTTPAAAPVACGTDGWTYGLCSTSGTPPETVAAPDWINDGYDTQNRYTGHPANIRIVSITVVARSTQKSPTGNGDAAPAVGNRPARAADAYKRYVATLSEKPLNLTSRAYFLPIAIGNVGGG
jgi:prepilin-type N-terminal cleavage/methylation domain-containing protein